MGNSRISRSDHPPLTRKQEPTFFLLLVLTVALCKWHIHLDILNNLRYGQSQILAFAVMSGYSASLVQTLLLQQSLVNVSICPFVSTQSINFCFHSHLLSFLQKMSLQLIITCRRTKFSSCLFLSEWKLRKMDLLSLLASTKVIAKFLGNSRLLQIY